MKNAKYTFQKVIDTTTMNWSRESYLDCYVLLLFRFFHTFVDLSFGHNQVR